MNIGHTAKCMQTRKRAVHTYRWKNANAQCTWKNAACESMSRSIAQSMRQQMMTMCGRRKICWNRMLEKPRQHGRDWGFPRHQRATAVTTHGICRLVELDAAVVQAANGRCAIKNNDAISSGTMRERAPTTPKLIDNAEPSTESQYIRESVLKGIQLSCDRAQIGDGSNRIAHSRAESGVRDLEGENGESRATTDARDGFLGAAAPKTGRAVGARFMDMVVCILADVQEKFVAVRGVWQECCRRVVALKYDQRRYVVFCIAINAATTAASRRLLAAWPTLLRP